MRDMTEGSLFSHLWRYALPLILANWLQLAYNAADSMIAGRFIGRQALAAEGIAAPVMNLVILAVSGLCIGAGVLMSERYGSKDMVSFRKSLSAILKAGILMSFAVMIPIAFIFCLVWPAVQHAIMQFQDFLKTSGLVGVWAYTFSERILLPAGLHHFIYLPFIFGPAVCDGGIQAYWLQHLNDFATSAHSLKDMFPEGGFALHGSSKVFGLPGAALAIYMCAKPEKRKKTAALLIPATLTAVICGITEPLEFTFLFVAPLLYLVHAVLSACLSSAAAAVIVTAVSRSTASAISFFVFILRSVLPLLQRFPTPYQDVMNNECDDYSRYLTP